MRQTEPAARATLGRGPGTSMDHPVQAGSIAVPPAEHGVNQIRSDLTMHLCRGMRTAQPCERKPIGDD